MPAERAVDAGAHAPTAAQFALAVIAEPQPHPRPLTARETLPHSREARRVQLAAATAGAFRAAGAREVARPLEVADDAHRDRDLPEGPWFAAANTATTERPSAARPAQSFALALRADREHAAPVGARAVAITRVAAVTERVVAASEPCRTLDPAARAHRHRFAPRLDLPAFDVLAPVAAVAQRPLAGGVIARPVARAARAARDPIRRCGHPLRSAASAALRRFGPAWA